MDEQTRRWLNELREQKLAMESVPSPQIGELSREELVDQIRNVGWPSYPTIFDRAFNTVIHPLEDLPDSLGLSPEEAKGYHHDSSHVDAALGFLDPVRESAWGFVDALFDRESFYAELLKDIQSGKTSEKIRQLRSQIARNEIFRQLFDYEALNSALAVWHGNYTRSAEAIYQTHIYPAQRAGIQTESQSLDILLESVAANMSNSFFALTQASRAHRVDVECAVFPGVEVQETALITKVPLNLAKNALKHAEDLYVKLRDFQGGKVTLFGIVHDGELYVGATQTFEGVDLAAYLDQGYQWFAQNHPITSTVDSSVRDRYHRWMGDFLGEEYGQMQVRDATQWVFKQYVSGAGLSSETSGLGLYAAQQLCKQYGGRIVHFRTPEPKLGITGEGFFLRLPLQRVEQRAA